MNFALLLAFCGVAVAFAAPSCDLEALEKQCGGLLPEKVTYDLITSWPSNAEDLDKLCPHFLSGVQCYGEFAERCHKSGEGLFVFYKDYEGIFGKLCVKSDPSRQKFFQHVSCLNKEAGTVERNCENLVKDLPFNNCKNFPVVIDCIQKEIRESCGSEGLDVYNMFFKAREDWLLAECGNRM